MLGTSSTAWISATEALTHKSVSPVRVLSKIGHLDEYLDHVVLLVQEPHHLAVAVEAAHGMG
jgi:hypothetical protein